MDYSLWPTILCQGMILSLTVFYYFKYLCSAYRNHLPFFLYIFIITFFTGASLHVSMILPDIFTSIAILSLGLLIFVNCLKILDFIIISLLLILSITVHNSHFAIVILLVLFLTIIILFRKIRLRLSFFKVKRLIYIWLLIVFSYLMSSLVHYSQPNCTVNLKKNVFSPVKGGSVFFISRLNDIGILKSYLDENCGKRNYSLCAYKNNLPTGLPFLWNEEISPLYKTGGWVKNEKEYKFIIKDILTTPKYLKEFMIKSIESGFEQFFSFDIKDIPVIPKESFAGIIFNKLYGFYKNEYSASLQNKNELDFTFINNSQKILFGLSLFILLIIIFSKVPIKYKLLIIYILFSLFINAGVCSTFSMIVPRYQGRIVWLLILPVIITFSNRDVISVCL